jgi:hypothetical protein
MARDPVLEEDLVTVHARAIAVSPFGRPDELGWFHAESHRLGAHIIPMFAVARRMPAAGLLIHPNTDDPPLHQVTPTRCWRMMVEDFGFGLADLRGFMLNGIRGSFLPESSRRHLETAFAQEFDALAAECFPTGVIA